MHLEGRDDSRQRQGLPLREVHRVGPTSRSSCPYRDEARTNLDSLTAGPSTANSSGETPAHYVITTPLLAAHAQPCPLPALSLSRLSIPCFLSLLVALRNYCTDMTCLSIPTCLSNPSFAVGLVTPNHTKVRVKKSRSITPQPWKRRCTENIRKKID